MTTDEQRVPEDPRPSQEGESSGSADEGFGASETPRQLPPQLQDWRVMEIDGTATVIDESGWRSLEASDEKSGTDERTHHGKAVGSSRDRIDEFIVLSIPERYVNAGTGNAGTFTLSVLNNAEHPVVLQLEVSGEISPDWFPELPMRLPLLPGERRSLVVMIAPPPGPDGRAGEHDFAFCAKQVDRPERFSKLNCTLRIPLQTGFQLGLLQPERIVTSWWSPTAQTVLPVSNLGNQDTNFRIFGGDADRECLFEFDAPGGLYAQVGQASFTLAPGEREAVGITVVSKRRPLVGLQSRERPFRIAVEMTDTSAPRSRQLADGIVASKALVGPWQMVLLSGSMLLVVAVIMLSSAALLLTLRPAQTTSPAVLPTQVPAPAFALVLTMDDPVPTRDASSAELVPPQATLIVGESAPRPGEIVQADGALPIVQQEQVSTPGQASAPNEGPAAYSGPPQPALPTPIAVAPTDPSNMTYAQMFQQIAMRYDLNWRMLAAQGYVESGFDSTAVGRHGSLGIMQIQPDTWEEWAPVVDATDPFDTYENVLVAALYLDYLRSQLSQEGYPQVEWMLAAYNWGPDKVMGMLSSGGTWSSLPNEVQQYAADVLRIAQSIPGN